MLIRVLLIAAAIVLLVLLVRRRHGSRTKAWARLLLVLLVVAFVVAVVQPDLLSELATWLGVGRGTDLLLYGLTVAFLYVVVVVYLKFRDLQATITDLARRLAIDEALTADGTRGRDSSPSDGRDDDAQGSENSPNALG